MIYVVYEYNKTGIKIIGAFKEKIDIIFQCGKPTVLAVGYEHG